MVVPLEASNLYDAIHERGWRPGTAEVVRLALQLAEACAHLHSQGVARTRLPQPAMTSSTVQHVSSCSSGR